MKSGLSARRAGWFIMLVALLVGMIPFGVSASSHHTATRTDVTFTSTTVAELDPGEGWADEAGIYHFRGNVIQDEFSGDITGTATITVNGDFEAVGECTEESCPGFFSVWGNLNVEGEGGGWQGTYVSFGSDVPGEEFSVDSLVLRGTGGNAHMSIVAQSTDEDETSITFEGVMSTLATPIGGLNTNVHLCADPETFAFGGGYLSTGAIDGQGGASGEFLVGGGPWTHTYAVAGTLTLTDEHGSVTIAFGGAAQDNYTQAFEASHVFGHFVILEGTGAYAELYGSGRILGTAGGPSLTCESGFGVDISMVGEVHYN